MSKKQSVVSAVTWPMTTADGETFEITETNDLPRLCRVSVSSKYDQIFNRMTMGGGGLKVAEIGDAKRVGQALKAWIKRGQHQGAARIQSWPDGTHRVFWVEKKPTVKTTFANGINPFGKGIEKK